MSKPILSWLTLLVALAQPAQGQGKPTPLDKGADMRILIAPRYLGDPERHVTGTLFRLNRDTCVLSVDPSRPDTAVFFVGRGSGRQLERRVAMHSHAGKGAAVGAVAGIVTGGLVAAFTWTPCSGWACLMHPDMGTATVLGAVAGLLGGVAIGTIVGAADRGEWEPVRTAGLQVTVAPRAVGVSLAFR